VQLREASLTAGKSRLETSGTLQTVDAMEYALKGRLWTSIRPPCCKP
jgi:translocation and assembly module TamB